MSAAWVQVLLAGLWGGLVAVERRAFLQAMLSRPLVAATVMGGLLGDMPSGLYIGMLLELFHLGGATLGAALPDNDTLSATGTAAAAACLASITESHSTPAIWSTSVLLFLWLGRLGRLMDRRLETYAARLAERARQSAEAGQLTRAVRQNLWGMWPHFLLFGGVTAACALVGRALGPLWGEVPLRLLRGLAWAWPAMASVAAALAVRGSHARNAPLYATLGVAVSLLAVAYSLREGL